jgi:bleomycin hydrolase
MGDPEGRVGDAPSSRDTGLLWVLLGKFRGEKGWFVVSDAWMDEVTTMLLFLIRGLCIREVRDVLDKGPLILPLWDPTGSLA